MGLALALVWNKGLGRKEVRLAVELFATQLLLNVLWSVLFFGLHSLISSLVEILVLWILIFITTKEFFKISRSAGYLMLPYILWVSFAISLNYTFWLLN
jgi:tryptophan-rich sensory protein